MARTSRRALPTSTSSSSDSSKPSAEAQKHNLTDGASLKRALDDAAADACTSSGYREDHFVSNVKLGLSFVLCILAALAQFWPGKFPDTWYVLATCVSLYGLGTLILNIFTARFEGDAFLFLRPEGAAKDPPAPLVRVSSRLPRFSYEYKLHIKADDGSQVDMQLDIQDFFTSDGHLAESKYKNEVQRLLQDVANQPSRGPKKLQ